MQDTNQFLKAAFQIGPWRVTRKVLLFVIVFCVVVIVFGTIVLKTHKFDEDWDDMDWDDDDDWDDGVSAGDSILLIIIGVAAIGALVSSAGCCMAGFNAPEHLPSDGPIFTLSGVDHTGSTGNQTGPVASAPRAGGRPRRQTGRVRADKVYPPTSDYPQGPSYPTNPGYPQNPPPYSAPGYPPPPSAVHQPGAPSPPAHTISDLPPPYAPGHYPAPQ